MKSPPLWLTASRKRFAVLDAFSVGSLEREAVAEKLTAQLNAIKAVVLA